MPGRRGQEREPLYPKYMGRRDERWKKKMAHMIDDATIEYVGILAQLELDQTEKEAAKNDMGRMLDYIDKLNELNTEGVEPMSHVFPVYNVFREDVVENGDDRENILKNAPESKDGAFKVPKTVE
jgi:aspartyl-tRNA(Asn)/glutamyl-tRNA(Gln) amidotransferase subunit C